jgi:serine/tyrosine/threonine adenylyltransferase
LDRLLAVVTAPFDERPEVERYAWPAREDFSSTTFCGT